MIKIAHPLGFVEYFISKEDIKIALELLLKAGVSVEQKEFGFVANAFEIKKINQILGTRVKFSHGKPKGALGYIHSFFTSFPQSGQ